MTDERARRLAHREATARHAAQHLECCRDATSLVDFRLLRRHHPEDWHRVLRDCFREPPEPGATLGDHLRAGAGGLLVPRSRLDTTIEKKRKAARHLADVLGHLLLEELDEERLEEARRRYVEDVGVRRASALIGHDLRVLRQAVERGRVALGLSPVAHAWETARPGSRRRRQARGMPSPREAQSLLARLEPVLRVAVVLMVGLGLRLEEVLRIRIGHLDWNRWEIRVAGNEHQAPVFRALPIWTQLIVWEGFPRLATMPRGQLLFESPDRPGHPRTDIGRKIRAAAIEAGLVEPEDAAHRFTPRSLRRLYQAVARANHLPSALVRGTLGTGQGDDQHEITCLPADRALARRWVELMRAPGVGADEHPYVPRKAPKGVGPMDPEVRPRSERWTPPWSPPPGCLEIEP
jgi:integrase